MKSNFLKSPEEPLQEKGPVSVVPPADGTILQWYYDPGDWVMEGLYLCAIESSGGTRDIFEVESPADGYLFILAEVGEYVYRKLTVIATVRKDRAIV